MGIMKKLMIEQLKEGFIFTDENDEKYAVSAGSLSKRVSAYFGLMRRDSHKRPEIKKTADRIDVLRDAAKLMTRANPHPFNTAPPAKVSEATKPETQGNKTADSHSAGATSRSLSTEHKGSNSAFGGINKGELDTSAETKALSQASPIPRETKLSTLDKILQPSDLKISKFDYDLLAKTQKYKTLEFLELPDGRVVLKYGGARYYSTKDAVMQIPFPFPRNYFSKENGWSSTVEYAFKMYRRHLAERNEPEGQPDGSCDDVAFETCANNNPETCKFCVNESRYEDKRKIAARKPGAPLLKASMGV